MLYLTLLSHVLSNAVISSHTAQINPCKNQVIIMLFLIYRLKLFLMSSKTLLLIPTSYPLFFPSQQEQKIPRTLDLKYALIFHPRVCKI